MQELEPQLRFNEYYCLFHFLVGKGRAGREGGGWRCWLNFVSYFNPSGVLTQPAETEIKFSKLITTVSPVISIFSILNVFYFGNSQVI